MFFVIDHLRLEDNTLTVDLREGQFETLCDSAYDSSSINSYTYVAEPGKGDHKTNFRH